MSVAAQNETALVAPPNGPGGMIDVAQSRQAQEVQAAMVVAKKFPRDEIASQNRIMSACRRKTLAEVAVYSYPRGGNRVEGPSIRLAEVLAQCWGNIDSGIVELEQRRGESTVMAYAWDLETNTRSTKVFTVKHERRAGKGDSFRIDHLSDPRDIYEMVANQGARRLRSCILAAIPGDVIESAVVECNKTMAGPTDEPIKNRTVKMVRAYEPYGVTQKMIEKNLGHKLEAISEVELAGLRKIYTSIKDGASKPEHWFSRDEQAVENGKSRTDVLADKLKPPKPTPLSAPPPPAAESVVLELEEDAAQRNPEQTLELGQDDGIPFDPAPPIEAPLEEPPPEKPPQQTEIPYVGLAACVDSAPLVTIATLGKIKSTKTGKAPNGGAIFKLELYDGTDIINCNGFGTLPDWAAINTAVDVQEMTSRQWHGRTFWTIKRWARHEG